MQERRRDVFGFHRRVAGEDLGPGDTGRIVVKNARDHDPRPADARLSMTDAGLTLMRSFQFSIARILSCFGRSRDAVFG
jgi:hypothetical protein